jgi:hypothetical protein
MMGPRITDYGWFNWCETCDHGYLPDEYNSEVRMCIHCAAVTETGGEDE